MPSFLRPYLKNLFFLFSELKVASLKPSFFSKFCKCSKVVEFSVLLSFFSSITSFDLVNLKIKFKTFINVCLGSDTKSSYLINR